MDHFPAVLAICRSALKQESPTVRRQITRLKDALESAGHSGQAGQLNTLLSSREKANRLAPSSAVLSQQGTAESLSTTTITPIDRESGTPLARIVWPDINSDNEFPVFPHLTAQSISTVLDEWSNVDRLIDAGIRPNTSLLIFGEPGTGKTELALGIGRHLEIPVITAQLSGLTSSFLGTTARNIANLFEFSNRFRSVLLLDEFDSLAKLRDDPQELGELKRVVNTLLQCLDSRREVGFTIAITNHQQLLDHAVWRRFDTVLETPLPDTDTRIALVERFLRDQAIPAEREYIAWLTAGQSGGEIENLCAAIARQNLLRPDDRESLASRATRLTLARGRPISMPANGIGDYNDEAIARALAADPASGFTQVTIASVLRTSQSTISRWLRQAG